MKKCEGCFAKEATTSFYDERADIQYDVCETCYRELRKLEESE